jgi:hypothetical protein
MALKFIKILDFLNDFPIRPRASTATSSWKCSDYFTDLPRSIRTRIEDVPKDPPSDLLDSEVSGTQLMQPDCARKPMRAFNRR